MSARAKYSIFLNGVEPLAIDSLPGQCFVACEYPKGENAPIRDLDDFRVSLTRGLGSTYKPLFTDKRLRPGHILRNECEEIAATSFGIYDISNPTNPNVFMELGIAIGLNKPFILTKRRAIETPEIIRGLDIFEWESLAELRNGIKPQVDKCLAHLPTDSQCVVCGTDCQSRLPKEPEPFYYSVSGACGIDFDNAIHENMVDTQLKQISKEALLQTPFSICRHCLHIRNSSAGFFCVTAPYHPEVFLQIGIAIASCRPWFLLARKGSQVPSNLAGFQSIEYTSFEDLSLNMRESVPQIVARVLDAQAKIRSTSIEDITISERFPRSWEDLLQICKGQVKNEIRASVGKKYIPDLYVNREIEERFEGFANKNAKLRNDILLSLNAAEAAVGEERERSERNISSFKSNLSEITDALRFIEDFEENLAHQELAKLWRNLNATIDYLDALQPATQEIMEDLHAIEMTLGLSGKGIVRRREELLDLSKEQPKSVSRAISSLAKRIAEQLKRQKSADRLKQNIADIDARIEDNQLSLSCLPRILERISEIHSILSDNREIAAITELETICKSIEVLASTLHISGEMRQVLSLLSQKISSLPKNCFLVIDRAGSGKTNLLCHLALSYAEQRPVVFIPGTLYLEDEFGLERYICASLGLPLQWTPEQVMAEIHTMVEERLSGRLDTQSDTIELRSSEMIVFIDGINESLNAPLFKRAMERLLSQYRNKRILFCVTCRDIYWGFFQGDFWDESSFEDIRGGLYNFADSEFEEALPRYLGHYRIECELIDEARNKCHQPLLLRFFCEAYGNSKDALEPIPKIKSDTMCREV